MENSYSKCRLNTLDKCHFFCLDTKEMTKEKVKTVEKYG
jgi:hypothetical protein